DVVPGGRSQADIRSPGFRQGHAPGILVAELMRVNEVAMLVQPVRQNDLTPKMKDVNRHLPPLHGRDWRALSAPCRPVPGPLSPSVVLPEQERLRRRQSLKPRLRIDQEIGVRIEKEDSLPAALDDGGRLGFPAAQSARAG